MTLKSKPKPERAADAAVVDENRGSLKLIIAALMLSMLMSSLGQMIFSTALPTIVGELGGVEHMSWVITAFLLGQTIAMPFFGKLGDQIGRKWLFIGANGLFMIGSIIGALAQNMTMLIIARAAQGVAGGAMMITSQAITADVTSPRERGKFMGVMGSVFGVSSVLGPVLGGWFTDGPGWRWGLWLNVPLAIITMVAITIILKLPKKAADTKIDWLGTLTMGIATASLVLFVTWGGNEYAWSSPLIIGLIISAIVFSIIFVFVELRATNPLIPMSLFSVRNFVLTTLVGLAIGMFMFGSLAYLPTYLQMVHGMTPTRAGLMMIPMMIGVMGTSIVVGNLISRSGKYRVFPIMGMVVTGIALILLSTLTPHTSLVVLGLYLFVFGFGIGCAMQVLVLIVQVSFPIEMVGTATGSNNFFRQVGGSLGSALVGGMFLGRLKDQMADKVMPLLAKMPNHGGAGAGKPMGPSNFTPALVSGLPEPLRDAVRLAYNDALTPVFLVLCPLAFMSAIVLFWIREQKLSENRSA